MKTLTVITVLILACIAEVGAQSDQRFELEFDPLAYALGGASGHVAYAWKNERLQLGYGQLSIPKAARNHENVREKFKSISLKWDYFIHADEGRQGFFAGPTFDFMFLTYEDEFSNLYKDEQLNIGLRLGYRFDLFAEHTTLSGLYITPWVGFSWFTSADDLTLGDRDYSRKTFNVFPTVHVGWKL